MSAPQLKRPFSNGVYYICWTEGRRSNRVSTRETNLDAAKAFFGQWLLMEREMPPDGAAFTAADLWAVYKAKHVDVKVASPQTLAYAWKNLEPHFGALQLSAITQDTIDSYATKRYLGKLGRQSKPSTVRRELNALRGCFGWCAGPRRKIIDPKVIPAFEVPPESAPRDRWLKADEMKALLQAAESARRGVRLSRVERFLWLALETAARKTAILELTWDRVDFAQNVIHYDVPGRVKTKKRRASVPISTALRPVLERAFAERINDFVCENQGAIWDSVQRCVVLAGLSPAQNVARGKKHKSTGVSPHVMRHTAATHMARSGVPLWVIAGILGNTTAVVEKTYGHHCPDGLRSGIEQISGGVVAEAVDTPEIDPAILAALRSGKFKLVEVA